MFESESKEEVRRMECDMILALRSSDPAIGYNQTHRPRKARKTADRAIPELGQLQRKTTQESGSAIERPRSKNVKNGLKTIAVVALLAISASSLLVACGKRTGDEFVGSWKVKDDIDSTLIARSGYDFVVTNTGDTSSRMFFRYEHGILVMSGSAGMLGIRYDKVHDAIVAFTPEFPVEIVLPRVK
ncbi:hypothetical protein LMG27952_07698 [Paraburkholderia hiiakae]|uniref:DUF5640 domain-containing protein n=1 Tax=Paraburkholderia hiiakae TaxID=1081782 RepID=A0ABM8PBP2_9BURK|nr:hypothetical protein [Paraburkholderia hiiakae]CAD6562172.1 hypothetical protein LMG27952_07698 [Paraburkholderia hiiakae]